MKRTFNLLKELVYGFQGVTGQGRQFGSGCRNNVKQTARIVLYCSLSAKILL